jgi:hypothetical protein
MCVCVRTKRHRSIFLKVICSSRRRIFRNQAVSFVSLRSYVSGVGILGEGCLCYGQFSETSSCEACRLVKADASLGTGYPLVWGHRYGAFHPSSRSLEVSYLPIWAAHESDSDGSVAEEELSYSGG